MVRRRSAQWFKYIRGGTGPGTILQAVRRRHLQWCRPREGVDVRRHSLLLGNATLVVGLSGLVAIVVASEGMAHLLDVGYM